MAGSSVIVQQSDMTHILGTLSLDVWLRFDTTVGRDSNIYTIGR